MSYGEDPNRVNAIGLCRGDVEADECRSYLNDSRANLAQSCPNQKEAVLWDEKCMLRYSNRSIFRLAEPSPSFVLVNPRSATNVEQFNEVLNNMLRNLADRAASGDSCRKYATQDTTWTNSQHIYGLVQCTPDLSPTDCKSCLVGAIEYIQTSICSDGKIGCRILRPSCNVRYENYPFSQQTTTPPPPTSHQVNTEELHYFCDGNNDRGNYSTNDSYDKNLKLVLTMTTLRAGFNSNNGFNGSWRGENADKVYAIAQCRGDVTPTECRQCLSRSSLNLTRLCPYRKEAIGWAEDEKCMLRYSDRSILGLSEIGPAYFVWNLHDAPNPQQFNQVVNNLLNRLKAQAVSSLSPPKYAASTATGPDGQLVYGLAQCTPDLSGPQCDSCLDQSIAEIPRCCNNRIGARIVRPSCYVRYETDFPFYGPPPHKP